MTYKGKEYERGKEYLISPLVMECHPGTLEEFCKNMLHYLKRIWGDPMFDDIMDPMLFEEVEVGQSTDNFYDLLTEKQDILADYIAQGVMAVFTYDHAPTVKDNFLRIYILQP